MCNAVRSGYMMWLIVLVFTLSGCAPTPIANTEVMSLYQGATQWGMAHPYFLAIQQDAAIAAWPIHSGTSSGVVGWGVACQSGSCPTLPGNFITGAAMSQFFNQLAGQGWQLFSRGSAILRVPLIIPVAPFEEQMKALPQS